MLFLKPRYNLWIKHVSIILRSIRLLSSDAEVVSSEAIQKSKIWLQTVDTSIIPKHLFEITYSRSSGPGGQKVNKTSSKATISLQSGMWLNPTICYWIPSPILEQLQSSPIRYETKSRGLVIQCDSSRNRDENTEECFRRLLEEIKSTIYFAPEVKEEDKLKWDMLQEDFKERKKFNKKKQSDKKRSRSKKFDL
ncbi:uncharacterized protein KGF55_000609 [Candida pseudojiufengensis]|uniref:uncharacterized protein n=1 Tax=Candida pseudojiufengensis TaxID=497109 RepID=UPI0022249FF3|nr:uncharacterized protein KGF55_000609 [Candida pseudojiufengensis]KAI5966300.1 hypothetical protein KGF55_000609 [Candida pseudojiufengensis]